MLLSILLMDTRRKLELHAHTQGTALNRDAQADVRGATQLPGHAVARGSCLSQILDRGAEATARGAARCTSHVLDRGAQAGAKTGACDDTTLSQQEKSTRQMRRRTEKILPASSAQRHDAPRGDIPSKVQTLLQVLGRGRGKGRVPRLVTASVETPKSSTRLRLFRLALVRKSVEFSHEFTIAILQEAFVMGL
jgi:hypothetical protein